MSESDQLQNRHYHTLDCRTYTSSVCDPQYFAVLPLLDEIETENENVSILNEKSFLENNSLNDESVDIPPLEAIPVICDIPSFLGTDFEDRQCGRITRSKSSRYNPIH